MKQQHGLGKGLGALLEEEDIDGKNSVKIVSINEIDTNINQPRKNFDQEKLQQLADSIKNLGVVQPIIVRKNGERYIIVAGERRWRATRLAGIKTIPVIIKDYHEDETIEIALIENIQREDLNPIEEAEAVDKLMKEHGYTQEKAADRLGKSRPAIANTLRLLLLPDEIKSMIKGNKLSEGNARALLTIKDKKVQIKFAEKIINEGLSVRETEKLIKNFQNMKKEEKKKNENIFYDIENELQNKFGTKVKIQGNEKKGKVIIEYYNSGDFDRIYNSLTDNKK